MLGIVRKKGTTEKCEWFTIELIKLIDAAIAIGLSNPIDFYKVRATFVLSG